MTIKTPIKWALIASSLFVGAQAERFNYNALPKPAVPNVNLSDYAIDANTLPSVRDLLQPKQGLMVFVSHSMPKESIRRYAKSLDRLGHPEARLVFIGLKKDASLLESTQALRKITKGLRVKAIIDPTAYQRFNITSVPAIVMYEDDPQKATRCATEGTDPNLVPDPHVGVYGDVNLQYALEYLAREHPNSRFSSNLNAFANQINTQL